VEEVGGLRFVLDRVLAGHLERYFPFAVDYDDRFWFGLRVRPSRGKFC
jgi:hypothetical protein